MSDYPPAWWRRQMVHLVTPKRWRVRWRHRESGKNGVGLCWTDRENAEAWRSTMDKAHPEVMYWIEAGRPPECVTTRRHDYDEHVATTIDERRGK